MHIQSFRERYTMNDAIKNSTESVGEQSLPDLLDKHSTPVIVRISRTCILKDEKILEEGQYVTVLNRKNSQLVYGKDWNGKCFRIYCNNQRSLVADTVEEYYPRNVMQYLEISNHITHIESKKQYNYNSKCFGIGEMFLITSRDKNGLFLIREKTGEKLYVNFESLFRSDDFVFVNIKERITFETLLRSFQPQHVRFVNSGIDKNLPAGNVKLKQILTYETIMTVTMITTSKQLRYETYNLDARIKVCLSNKKLPKKIRLLGKSTEKKYIKKIEEIEFLTHYDIYAGRFYGFVNLENPYSEEDKHLLLKHKEEGKSVELDYKEDKIEHSNIPAERVNKCFSLPRTLQKPTSLYLKKENKRIEWVNASGRKELHKPHRFKTIMSKLSSPTREKKLTKFYSLDELASYSTSAERKELLEFQNIVASETGNEVIGDPQDIIQMQQQELDRIKQNRIVDDTLSRHEVNREQENPLYRFDSVPRSTVKSKPLSWSASFTNITGFFSKPNKLPLHSISNSIEKASTPFYQHESATVSNNGLSISNSFDNKVLHQFSSSENGIDSGIDSPSGKKSLESIFESFEKLNLQEKRTLSESEKPKLFPKPKRVDIRDASSEDRLLSDQLKQNMDNVMLNRKEISASTPSLTTQNVYTDVDYAEVKSSISCYNKEQQREIWSIRLIKSYNIKEIVEMLKEIQLHEFVDKFQNQMINGKLLMNLIENEIAIAEDLKLNKFQSRKLYKYVHGWRPTKTDLSESKVNDADVIDWSVQNVNDQMAMINLKGFGSFCAENEIDGVLLKDIIENKLISSLKMDYGIKFNSIEYERLRSFVNKEIKYNTGERKKFYDT